MSNAILSNFNAFNSLEQEKLFLNQKYASLLSTASGEQEQELLNKLKSFGVQGLETTDDLKQSLGKEGILALIAPLDTKQREDVLEIFENQISKIQGFKQIFESDCNYYLSLMQEIQNIGKGTIEGKNKASLHHFLEKKIGEQLKNALNHKETLTQAEKNTLEISGDREDEDEISSLLREELVDPLVYFHAIQTIFRKYNYVLTFEDIGRLKKILTELNQGRIVFLSGDTGSGKTELALLVAQLYLDSKGIKNRKAILIGGSRETDLSDFTLEKVISSENMMSKSSDDLIRGERNGTTLKEKVLDTIIDKSAIKNEIMSEITQGEKTDEEKEQLKQEIEQLDLDKYHIFTKYHAKGLIKAMHDGVPLIIDEMNAIRPEVLIGLNHYFTRKVGEKITLPNGLGSFEIKEGFCILATGNDKEANTKKDMYEGRYKIDESLINRMSVIEKGYMHQIDEQFSNSNLSEIDEQRDQLEYLNANEIYGVLLMLLLDPKKKKGQRLTTSSKVGFEIMKESLVGKTAQETKSAFFLELKKFAIFIKKLQDAFERKHAVMCDGVDISNLITKRAFSMRNVREILSDYQEDSKSLYYHIYNKYLSQGNGNDDEYTGVLLALKETGLLPFQVNGSLNLEGKALEEMKQKLANHFLREKNAGQGKLSLLGSHNKKTPLTQKLLDSKVILTKQDVYKEYFGKELNTISDQDLLTADYEDFIAKAETGNEAINGGYLSSFEFSKEIEQADIIEQAEILEEQLKLTNNAFLENLSFEEYTTLDQIVKLFSRPHENAKKGLLDIFRSPKSPQQSPQLTAEELKTIFSIFNKIITKITEGTAYSPDDETDFTMLNKFLGTK
ncbi:MAG: hypothetical protein ACFN4U_03905 [Candidatus Absconditicoccaceae bacterium]